MDKKELGAIIFQIIVILGIFIGARIGHFKFLFGFLLGMITVIIIYERYKDKLDAFTQVFQNRDEIFEMFDREEGGKNMGRYR